MCYENINFSYAEGNKVFIHSLSAADLSFLRPKLINHNEVINKSFTSFISFLESTLPAHQKEFENAFLLMEPFEQSYFQARGEQ